MANVAKKILPVAGKKNVLVTAALPYVNNVPHLGNIIGSVLSADVFARYSRARGHPTLFICGTDEYGTATETKALEEGVSPQELCDRYHALHKETYEWFNISFDHFGRTSTDRQTQITQDIFFKLLANGYLEERTTTQAYCEKHNGFLADRFVEGQCPFCGYSDARGDQCDQCSQLLDPLELENARCKLDGATPVPRETKHIFLMLDRLQDMVGAWSQQSNAAGIWSENGASITSSWLKKGLQPRGITRDLKWGTPVPVFGYEDKVFYVWFDACIGYLSITAEYTEEWEQWWRNPSDVTLFQFMGKDNVPFHSIVFPSSQLGTQEKWTMLNTLSTTEYLNYEHGKFSKSRNIGVFGNSARLTGVNADVWRYFLLLRRPETSDTEFEWRGFIETNNTQLIANFGNFINRTLKFVNSRFNSTVPPANVASLPTSAREALRKHIAKTGDKLAQYRKNMEAARLKAALVCARELSSLGNKLLQEHHFGNELFEKDRLLCDSVVSIAVNHIHLLASVIEPFMPATAKSVLAQLQADLMLIPDVWSPESISPDHQIGKATHLFKAIKPEKAEEWRKMFGSNGSGPSGETELSACTQSSTVTARKDQQKRERGTKARPLSPALIDLRVGHILKVEKHPNADSLYVSTIACGDPPGTVDTAEFNGQTVRTVCSGLNGLIPLAELQDARVLVVCNLKPVSMRGIRSCAMLLAATSNQDDQQQANGIELVQPPPDGEAGDRAFVEGHEDSPEPALNPKKKIWEDCQACFTTTSDLTVVFDSKRSEKFLHLNLSQPAPLRTKGGLCKVRSLQGASVR